MSNTTFLKHIEVKWADVDPIMHARYSVYAEYSDLARVGFFSKHGIPFSRFIKERRAPIIFSCTSEFKREVLLGEKVSIDCQLVSDPEKEKGFEFRHNIYKQNGELAAVVTVTGAWFDMDKRKVIATPDYVRDAVRQMDRVETGAVAA